MKILLNLTYVNTSKVFMHTLCTHRGLSGIYEAKLNVFNWVFETWFYSFVSCIFYCNLRDVHKIILKIKTDTKKVGSGGVVKVGSQKWGRKLA